MSAMIFRVTPLRVAGNMGFLYAYGALQCPLEYIHGRRSLAHNGLAAGIIGGYAVSRGWIGMHVLCC